MSRSSAGRKILWSLVAQRGEYYFHKNYSYRPGDMLEAESTALFRHFGYERDRFNGKVVLDVGAGSQLQTKYFQNARIVAIEPLADRFLSCLEWCGLKEAEKVYSLPAEERIKELAGRVDFAVCINVLDHCYEPLKVVKNMYDYLRPGGELCLAVDCHTGADLMHQQAISEKWLRAAIIDAGFSIKREIHGLSTVYPGKKGFGHGEEDTVTYIALKPVAGEGTAS